MEAIVGEKYFNICIANIHNNPVKQKFVKQEVNMMLGGFLQLYEDEMDFIEYEFKGKLKLGEAIEQTIEKLMIRNKKEIINETCLNCKDTLILN